MLRLLHTADVHLGAKFKYLGEKAQEQREQLKKTFSSFTKKAIDKKADIVLVAGDLFDSNDVLSSTTEFVKQQFKILEKHSIKVCILAGTHDSLEKESSIYSRENFFGGFSNVFVFSDPNINRREYPELDLTVWGRSNVYSKSAQSPIIKLERTNTKYNVLMAHGSVQIEGKSAKDDYPITFDQIRDSGMDYIALGHWHSFGDYSQGNTKCFYSGSPEFIDIDHKDSGNVLFVEIKEKGDASVEPIKIGKTKFNKMKIDMGEAAGQEDLNAFLHNRILADADKDLIKVVELTGLVSPDSIIGAQDLEMELAENFLRLKIINNSHLSLDLINEKDYPEELVTGQFIRLMKKKIQDSKNEQEKRILEQAINLGLAELSGKSVL